MKRLNAQLARVYIRFEMEFPYCWPAKQQSINKKGGLGMAAIELTGGELRTKAER